MVKTGGDQPENKKKSEHPTSGPGYVRYAKYAAAGLEFPSTVLGSLLLGHFLDEYFESTPWFTGSLTLLGLVAAFMRLFQWMRFFSRK